jgi:hypothetical protein
METNRHKEFSEQKVTKAAKKFLEPTLCFPFVKEFPNSGSFVPAGR